MTHAALQSPQAAAPWSRRITALALLASVVAVIAVFAPGPLYRLGVVGLKPAFSVATFGAGMGALAVLAALSGLVMLLVASVRRYRLRAAIALLLGLVAVVPPLLFMQKAKSVPKIHDISTDTVDPPAFVALLVARQAAPNGADYGGPDIAAQQRAAYPDIRTLHFDQQPANVFTAALDVARSMGWIIAAQSPEEGRIEASTTTAWFGFTDDMVIRVRPDAKGSALDIRSESRLGLSDVGANAARIRAFREKLDATLGLNRAR